MKLQMTLVSSLLLASASAFAADPVTVNGGTVNFEGEFVNAACAVATQSANQTVVLGQYRSATLAQSGDTTSPVPFTIRLTDCDETVQATASVSFNGSALGVNQELLSVNAAGSNSGGNAVVAQNVGIQITDHTQKILGFNTGVFSTAKDLIKGDNILEFTARYVATGAVTPGAANATATFLVHYE